MERTQHPESPPLEKKILSTVDGVPIEPGETFVNTRDGHNAQLVQRHAEHIADLLAFSAKPAVLITSEWHVLGIPFVFENKAIYETVAAGPGYVVVLVEQPESGGLEHLLFMAKAKGLTDQEYLACRIA